MKCGFIKPSGARCNAYAVSNSSYCFRHDPAKVEEAHLASRKGGERNRNMYRGRSNILNIKSPKDVVELLESTINDVRTGVLDTRVANAIGYLSSHIIKAIEVSELEKRLGKIEAQIQKHGNQK